MLDLHCHLLPGVDDGAADLDAALDMARALRDVGFHAVAASPHFGIGPGGHVPAPVAASARERLGVALADHGVALALLPNAEHHLSAELFPQISAGEIVPIGAGRWLLIELPWGGLPLVEHALFRVQAAGHKVLLAHPERYGYLDLATLRAVVTRGVRLQLELGSFIGMYGHRVQQRAWELADSGCAHVIATDLHRPKGAPQWLRQALDALRGRYGDEGVRVALHDNPMGIVNDVDSDAVVDFTHP